MRWNGALALAGAGALLLLTATPAAAVDPVSQASGSALSLNLAGRTAGSGEFVATNDGKTQETSGTNTPALPILGDQQAVVGGAVGQDAIAKTDGSSAACAGLVGRNGTVEVGPHGSCLTDSNGRVILSLGSLDALGLGDILGELPQLPDLPELPSPDELPAMELRIEGNAITASCEAEPGKANGKSAVLDAEVVAIVSGQRVPIADIPPGGLTVSLKELLEQLPELPGLGDVLDQLIDQLPGDDLETPILTITTDEQIREQSGKLHVTALRVAAGPDALLDIRVGKATCGPNAQQVTPTPTPTPTSTPTPTPSPTDVPTSVPAGLASTPGDGDRTATASYGLGTLALLGVAGLVLGGYLHRVRSARSAPTSSE